MGLLYWDGSIGVKIAFSVLFYCGLNISISLFNCSTTIKPRQEEVSVGTAFSLTKRCFFYERKMKIGHSHYIKALVQLKIWNSFWFLTILLYVWHDFQVKPTFQLKLWKFKQGNHFLKSVLFYIISWISLNENRQGHQNYLKLILDQKFLIQLKNISVCVLW